MCMMVFFCKHLCIFCDTLSKRKIDLCAACEDGLPVLKNYCTRCAEPLPEGQDICGSCLDSSSLIIKTTVRELLLTFPKASTSQTVVNN